jgi:hypothetical protein
MMGFCHFADGLKNSVQITEVIGMHKKAQKFVQTEIIDFFSF